MKRSHWKEQTKREALGEIQVQNKTGLKKGFKMREMH